MMMMATVAADQSGSSVAADSGLVEFRNAERTTPIASHTFTLELCRVLTETTTIMTVPFVVLWLLSVAFPALDDNLTLPVTATLAMIFFLQRRPLVVIDGAAGTVCLNCSYSIQQLR